MNFPQAVISGFKNYANAHGRASRSEYWYWSLFYILGVETAKVLDGPVFHVSYTSHDIHPLRMVFMLITFLPQLAVGMRRLHDINRSGKWILIGFTIIGLIFPLLVWNCRKGTEGDNRFGSDPLSTAQKESTLLPSTGAALFCIFIGIFGAVFQQDAYGSIPILAAGWLLLAWDGFRSFKKGEV